MNRYIYWLLPLVLFAVQALFTLNSLHQIRYEELAESVRNVWWLQKRLVYDGISTNVGWYAPLLVIYNVFGFSLFSAKFFRLFLHLLALFSLAAILKKYLTTRYAWLPLVTLGLSPTMLYFTSLQAQYGIDLQYLPIVLYLLLSKRIIVFWGITMLALMSYSTFFFYLPALFLLFLRFRQLRESKKIMLSIVSFLAPLLGAFLFVLNRQLLLFDPVNKGGIFRGGGQIMFNDGVFAKSIEGLFSDLFVKATSYYFEVAKGEFSDIYPIATVALVVILAVCLFLKEKKYRMVVGLSFSTFLGALLVYGFSFDPSLAPGIRRATAVLATFYALFAIVWHWAVTGKIDTRVRWGMWVILLLLLVHHVVVLPANVIALKKASLYREQGWFSIAETPEKSLAAIVDVAQKENLRLGCQSQEGQVVACRLSEVYASVAGSCYWNRLPCKNIMALDPKTGKLIPLSTKLWEEYYFEH